MLFACKPETRWHRDPIVLVAMGFFVVKERGRRLHKFPLGFTDFYLSFPKAHLVLAGQRFFASLRMTEKKKAH